MEFFDWKYTKYICSLCNQNSKDANDNRDNRNTYDLEIDDDQMLFYKPSFKRIDKRTDVLKFKKKAYITPTEKSGPDGATYLQPQGIPCHVQVKNHKITCNLGLFHKSLVSLHPGAFF